MLIRLRVKNMDFTDFRCFPMSGFLDMRKLFPDTLQDLNVDIYRMQNKARGSTHVRTYLKNEETRSNKRASSIGASIRRLFSQSPAPQERSSSETKSILGQPTPDSQESSNGAVTRGRTPPKTSNSPNVSFDSLESSTSLPNNMYFVPTELQRA